MCVYIHAQTLETRCIQTRHVLPARLDNITTTSSSASSTRPSDRIPGDGGMTAVTVVVVIDISLSGT